jgi:uncharacterized repeat protein (TIGR01451 family)
MSTRESSTEAGIVDPVQTKTPRHVGPNPRRSRSSRIGRGLSKAFLAIVQGTFIASTLLVAPVIAANPSASLDQCANDPAPSLATDGCSTSATQWVNGNLGASKSFYREGDSIPYRLTFDNLATTGTHTVTIEWDTTKSSKHAIDFLTTYNRTVADANPCLGVTGCVFPDSPSTFPIPVDPQVSGASPPVTQIPGVFTFWGATITSVSAYSYSSGSGFVGDKSASIVISFTASVANPVLAWGGHIATRQDWGSANSAVAISGSPYHTRLLALDGSGGNQDRSLSAGAVFFPASITIIKDATPNGPTSFPFTATPNPPLSDFPLVDNGTGANTKVFGNILAEATYTVTETPVPSGWAFDSITCSVTSANGGSTTVTGAKVDIVLKEGENWTCTYANHLIPEPALTISKTADAATYSNVGDVINYTITTTNTGNVTVHAVTVTDSTGLDSFTCLPSNPADLAPTEAITCTGSHTIDQGDMDAGSFLNAACAKGTEADAGCDDVTVTTTKSPALTVDKSSTTTVITAADQVVPYSYVVTNTGNITLTGITVTDDKVLAVSCPATTLAPGASMTCTGSHTVTAAEFAAGGNLTNIATADSDQTDPPVTDTVSIPITPPTVVAQITPTATTCQQFAAGTSATLDTLLYSVKGNPPRISQVSPGVFFYWVKVSGSGTYTITQTSSPAFKPFNIASGSAVWSASCSKVSGATITQNTTTGTVTVTFTGTGTFYIGLKFDSGSVKDQPQPSPTTVHYTFSTTGVPGSSQGIDLKKK